LALSAASVTGYCANRVDNNINITCAISASCSAADGPLDLDFFATDLVVVDAAAAVAAVVDDGE
jgi:hypothetical protein